MKSRIAATIMLVLLLLYPLSMGPAARLVSDVKFYNAPPESFPRLLLYFKVYRPFLGDHALGRIMAAYTRIWVSPSSGSTHPAETFVPDPGAERGL